MKAEWARRRKTPPEAVARRALCVSGSRKVRQHMFFVPWPVSKPHPPERVHCLAYSFPPRYQSKITFHSHFSRILDNRIHSLSAWCVIAAPSGHVVLSFHRRQCVVKHGLQGVALGHHQLRKGWEVALLDGHVHREHTRGRHLAAWKQTQQTRTSL